ncbi:unnamed protein product [Fusarium fujikuroi]|nr:unnamed protein product [Fusarium fujikuroi]
MDVITFDRLSRQRGVILAMVLLVLVGLVIHIYALVFSPAYGTMKPGGRSRDDLHPFCWTVGHGISDDSSQTEWDTGTKSTINKEVEGVGKRAKAVYHIRSLSSWTNKTPSLANIDLYCAIKSVKTQESITEHYIKELYFRLVLALTGTTEEHGHQWVLGSAGHGMA